MKEYVCNVVNELGMHARPAGAFVKLAKEHNSKIEIIKGDQKVDAVRILAVMRMGIKQGDTITITVTGDDEDLVMEEVEKVCQENL